MLASACPNGKLWKRPFFTPWLYSTTFPSHCNQFLSWSHSWKMDYLNDLFTKLMLLCTVYSMNIHKMKNLQLPSTVTWMLRFHSFPETSVNRQLNTPSSEVETLKIIRVTCPLTQLTLNLEVKTGFRLTTSLDDTVATPEPSNCKVTNTRLNPCSRVNLQFSALSLDPSWSCMLFVWTKVWSVTVSTGGGSDQVIPCASALK